MTNYFFKNLLILSCGVVMACNSGEPAEGSGGASQSSTSTGGSTSQGSATGASDGGATEPVTGSGSVGETTGSELTTSSGTSTGAPGTSTGVGETETGTSTGALDLCADFKLPGCQQESDCEDGEVCKVVEEHCVPSDCICDPRTGEQTCTPDCGGASCVPGCSPVLCDLDCEFGFETDRNDCEVCACKEGPPPDDCGCLTDKECVKTSSGCCGCHEGGDEVAAHVSCVDQVKQCNLPPDDIFCLQVYLCTDATPACVAGQCVLQNI